MISIECPWCGCRPENEFVNGGEAHVRRPGPPEAVSEREWADYLFFNDNPKGLLAETWFHKFGCRQWLNAIRDTATHEIIETYRIGEASRIWPAHSSTLERDTAAPLS